MPEQPSGHASGPVGQPGRSQVARPRYRLYIDESGDHVVRDEDARAQPANRFLALCGCIFRGDDYGRFHDEWEGLKRRHFPHSPDERILIHRSDIINCRGPFWRLRAPEANEAFCEDLLRIIGSAQFLVVMVVLDKLLWPVWPVSQPGSFHPYHVALDFMLRSYSGFLSQVTGIGDVMAESRGGTEDRLLKSAYRHIHAEGGIQGGQDSCRRVLSSKEIKLEKKAADISGLQLADTLVHPLRQAILAEAGVVATREPTFGTRLARLAEAKYHRQPDTGRVEGYGKLLLPEEQKRPLSEPLLR